LIIHPENIGPCGFFSFVVDLDVPTNLAQCEAGKAF
jgi:hypothetical protein